MPICKGSSITVSKLLSTNDLVRHRIIPPKLSIRNRLAGADEGKHHECSNFYRAMHYSAKRGLVIACRPSVRPSVTLADQDHIGWKSWKLTARSIRPTPSLFVAQRPSTYSLGNIGNFGETRGAGGEKWNASTKVAISLKRVKTEEKLLWKAYRNSPTLFRTVPSPTPTA